MNFEKVAKSIIRDSIRSAVCIDDKYAAPYDITSGLETVQPHNLYKSFREKGNCALDIYNFKTLEESWKKDYMLSNQDLVILDWELDEHEIIKYNSTLKILRDIIESSKVLFVVIYTNTPDLNDVATKLIQEFSPYAKNGVFNFCKKVQDLLLVDEIDEIERFLDSIKRTLLEHFIYPGKRDAIKEDLIKDFCKYFSDLKFNGKDLQGKFYQALKATYSKENGNDNILELTKNFFSENDLDGFTIDRIDVDYLALKIDSTSIILMDKASESKMGGIEPDHLFETFSKIIIKAPHNYLTLLSLELKDKLRQDFSIIGNKFSKIDEKAFFYHINNYKEEDTYQLDLINDFILKSWIEDLSQHNYNIQSQVLNFVSKKASEWPLNLERDNNLINELSKYSAFVSTSQLPRKNNSKLRFGDIFVESENENIFFLCITPHCDCLRPTKINNNFYFVIGEKIGLHSALVKAETGYVSFIDKLPECVAIKWRTKPFTLHIKNNNINSLTFTYCEENKEVKHLTVLKDNYTQRIANESFGYGYRIGVDLPHVKGEPEEE